MTLTIIRFDYKTGRNGYERVFESITVVTLLYRANGFGFILADFADTNGRIVRRGKRDSVSHIFHGLLQRSV